MMAAPLGRRIGPTKNEGHACFLRADGAAFEERRCDEYITTPDIRF
jgi:hypothetical protein